MLMNFLFDEEIYLLDCPCRDWDWDCEKLLFFTRILEYGSSPTSRTGISDLLSNRSFFQDKGSLNPLFEYILELYPSSLLFFYISLNLRRREIIYELELNEKLLFFGSVLYWFVFFCSQLQPSFKFKFVYIIGFLVVLLN